MLAFALLTTVLVAAPKLAASEKTGSGSQSGSSGKSGSSDGGQSGSKQSASKQDGSSGSQDKTATPGGITGGSSPIESTMFAYQALAADAHAIAGEIRGHVSGPYVLTTADDIAIILQWRTVLEQAQQLQTRLDDATQKLSDTLTGPIPNQCLAKQGGGLPGVISPSDIRDLLQTIASVTAVNETLAPTATNITDLPLMNLVAAELKSAPVFAPSLLPSLLLQFGDQGPYLGKGPLHDALDKLNTARQKALPIAGRVALQNWQVVANRAHDGDVPCTEFAGKAKAAADELNAAIAAADSFTTSLFSGKLPQASVQSSKAPADKSGAQPSAQTAGQPTGAAAKQNAKTQGKKSLKPPAGAQNGQLPDNSTPAAPLSNPTFDNQGNAISEDKAGQAATTDQGAKAGQTATASSPTAPGAATLQQILVADLLYQALAANAKAVPFDHVHFVEVHSLESGGGALTKSNLFTGSRIYFGGGAVTTFGVYDYAGALECGGVAYAYQGYVRVQDVAQALDREIKAKLNSSCH